MRFGKFYHRQVERDAACPMSRMTIITVTFPQKESSVAPKVKNWPTSFAEATLLPVYPAAPGSQVHGITSAAMDYATSIQR